MYFGVVLARAGPESLGAQPHRSSRGRGPAPVRGDGGVGEVSRDAGDGVSACGRRRMCGTPWSGCSILRFPRGGPHAGA